MNLIPKSNSYFLEDVFSDFFDSKASNSFNCDIYEKDNKYFIEMDIPGFTKDNTIIECNNGYLTITVSKGENNAEDSKNYIRRERKYSNFSRSFYIGNIDSESIKAIFKNGTLNISFPKEERKEKNTILIEEN